MEIEPDGQQFLNAADDPAGDSPSSEDASSAPPPPSGGGHTTTIVVVAVVIVVLLLGGVALLALTGDDGARRELETGAAGEVDLRDRVEETTTTEAPTTSSPPTTEAPVEPAPFPDFGPPPPAVPPGAPAPVPGAVNCPGGGIATRVVSTSITQTSASSVDLVITGTSVNNTTAAVTLDLSLTITHNGTSQPTPWIAKPSQSRPTVGPGETSNWTFNGTLSGGTSASVSAIGGGFRWADPANASCPTQ